MKNKFPQYFYVQLDLWQFKKQQWKKKYIYSLTLAACCLVTDFVPRFVFCSLTYWNTTSTASAPLKHWLYDFSRTRCFFSSTVFFKCDTITFQTAVAWNFPSTVAKQAQNQQDNRAVLSFWLYVSRVVRKFV